LGEIINAAITTKEESSRSCMMSMPVRHHRTKCSAIITNVLGPSFSDELRTQIGNQPYSIILDESTDVSQEKLMAYCVQYFNSQMKKIVIDFLGFQVVHRTTADVLTKNFKQFLTEVGLKLDNLIAIGTDGASNLCGKNHSLFTELKKVVPKLVILKCICHSLTICVRKACTELPSNLDFLIRETRNWFCHSPLRLHLYRSLYKKLNSGKAPPKLTQLSTTRWLAFGTAVKENIDMWDSLKAHFSSVSKDTDRTKNCYLTRTLAGMYEDQTNYLYFLFLNSILDDVTRVNLIFQSNEIDIVDAYTDLRILTVSISKRIFKPSFLKIDKSDLNIVEVNVAELEVVSRAISAANAQIGNSYLPIDSVDYGYNFQQSLLKGTNLAAEQIAQVKERCRSFLLHLCAELMTRMPSNFMVVQKLQYFSPKYCFGKTVSFDQLPLDLLINSDAIENIRSQWVCLQSMKFQDFFCEEDITVNNVDMCT
jgi:hypothetical protein